MKRFYVIYAAPDGSTDFESGPDGPFTFGEAVRNAQLEPDPVTGWRSLILVECDPSEPGGWRDEMAAAILADPGVAERARALRDGEWTGFAERGGAPGT